LGYRETLKEKYDGKLQKTYDAPTYEIVSTVFRALTGRKVTVPSNFRRYMFFLCCIFTSMLCTMLTQVCQSPRCTWNQVFHEGQRRLSLSIRKVLLVHTEATNVHPSLRNRRCHLLQSICFQWRQLENI